MDAVHERFVRKFTPISAPYTTGSWFASSGHSARSIKHGKTPYNLLLRDN